MISALKITELEQFAKANPGCNILMGQSYGQSCAGSPDRLKLPLVAFIPKSAQTVGGEIVFENLDDIDEFVKEVRLPEDMYYAHYQGPTDCPPSCYFYTGESRDYQLACVASRRAHESKVLATAKEKWGDS